jgi:hypothetical protein
MACGFKSVSGSRPYLIQRIEMLGLDTNHFDCKLIYNDKLVEHSSQELRCWKPSMVCFVALGHTPFLIIAAFAATVMPSSVSTPSTSADSASVKELIRSVS